MDRSTEAAEAREPAGGWATTPRPPLTAALTAEDVSAFRRAAVVVGLGRPTVFRCLLGVLAGVVTAWTSGLGAGLLVGVAAAVALAGLPLVVVARGAASQAPRGARRTTGYDADGRLVLVGSTVRVLPPGWARSIERRGAVAVLRPDADRGAAPLVRSRLLTRRDEELLLHGPGEVGEQRRRHRPPARGVVHDARRGRAGDAVVGAL